MSDFPVFNVALNIFQENNEHDTYFETPLTQASDVETLARCIRWFHPSRVLEQHFKDGDRVVDLPMPSAKQGYGPYTTARVTALDAARPVSDWAWWQQHTACLVTRLYQGFYAGQELLLPGQETDQVIRILFSQRFESLTRKFGASVHISEYENSRLAGGGIELKCRRIVQTPLETLHDRIMRNHLEWESIVALDRFRPRLPCDISENGVMPITLPTESRGTALLLLHFYTEEGEWVTQDIAKYNVDDLSDLAVLVNGYTEYSCGRDSRNISRPATAHEAWRNYSDENPQVRIQDIVLLPE